MRKQKLRTTILLVMSTDVTIVSEEDGAEEKNHFLSIFYDVNVVPMDSFVKKIYACSTVHIKTQNELYALRNDMDVVKRINIQWLS